MMNPGMKGLLKAVSQGVLKISHRSPTCFYDIHKVVIKDVMNSANLEALKIQLLQKYCFCDIMKRVKNSWLKKATLGISNMTKNRPLIKN